MPKIAISTDFTQGKLLIENGLSIPGLGLGSAGNPGVGVRYWRGLWRIGETSFALSNSIGGGVEGWERMAVLLRIIEIKNYFHASSGNDLTTDTEGHGGG